MLHGGRPPHQKTTGDQMPQANAATPVPIRLAYRYPNGSMVSYNARALAHDDSRILAVVNEEFEPGISIAVMAPFLDGMTTARVASAIRSKKQPGYHEVVLSLDAETLASGNSAGTTSSTDLTPPSSTARSDASKRWALAHVPAELGEGARQLGNFLEVV